MENTQNEVNLKKGVNNSNNMATNQGSLDDKLLEAYVGKKYQIIKNKKFSVPAFFFGYLYTAYRKYYSLTFIILLINFLVALFVKFATFNDATLATISAVTNIVLDIIVSFNFNKWYLNDAEKRVQKIKSDNPSLSENDLVALCSKKGKPSIGTSIICLLAYSLFISVVTSIIGA